MDYAEDKYGKKLVEDIKATLRVLLLYIPLPVFWALFDQQGSGWTFQARRMDGDLGFYTILPEQMQIVNPLLILIFIPLFEYIIYPLLTKCNVLTKPLHRIVCGGLLAAVAFFISAGISLAIEAENPVLPTATNGQLRIYNNLNCKIEFDIPTLNSGKISIGPMDYYEKIDIELSGTKAFDIKSFDGSCFKGTLDKVTLKPEKSIGYYFLDDTFTSFEDSVEKSSNGYPKFR